MPMMSSLSPVRRRLWLALAVNGALIALLVGILSREPDGSPEPQLVPKAQHPAGPPWRYGSDNARFTIVLYADLECPYCRTYTPVLRRWVDDHPDVSLQWYHLPLPMHQSAAGEEARWVECVGEAFGHQRFWDAVAWVYQHTRGDGQGLPPGVPYPERNDAVLACMSSDRPNSMVRRQANLARRTGITATPSLRLVDHQSNRSLVLTGPVEGDVLLSAIDLLAAAERNTTTPELSADVASDMPR